MSEDKYIVLEKKIGETPLECLENWRFGRPDLFRVPMAYAGRLDPMASGKLLILIGDECKNQTAYHHLDKEYQVEILFGVKSDSGDVLGIVSEINNQIIDTNKLTEVIEKLVGEIELPYPIFSAKTVLGKPLHTWTMENRLHEITIPTRKSEIYQINLNSLSIMPRHEVAKKSLVKIELIPPVVDHKKALGNDFRRPHVRKSWYDFRDNNNQDDIFFIANISCLCSSGTYMRTLAEVIARGMNTGGLAFSIHRTAIGLFDKKNSTWSKKF